MLTLPAIENVNLYSYLAPNPPPLFDLFLLPLDIVHVFPLRHMRSEGGRERMHFLLVDGNILVAELVASKKRRPKSTSDSFLVEWEHPPLTFALDWNE